MTNFLQTADGGGSQDLAPLDDIAASLASVNMLAGSNTGNPFLKLDQKGSGWLYGRDGAEVMDDDLWAINPQSFEKGYIAWGDSRNVLAESMVPASAPLPGLETLPQIPPKFKYDQQLKLDLAAVDQPDDVTVTFKTTAYGGKTAIGEVGQKIGLRAQKGNPFIVPVVLLTNTSYESKHGNTILNPVFDVQYWLDMEGNREGGAPKVELVKDEPKVDPKPKPRKRGNKAAA